MPSGLPTFNLRHFMAHLAPGAYLGLQAFFVLLFLAWLFVPDALGCWDAINQMNAGVAAGIGFLVLTVCYFAGVVVRFVPVNKADDRAIDYRLRRMLARSAAGERTTGAVAGFIFDVFFFVRWFFRWNRKEITCSEARGLLERAKGQLEKAGRQLRRSDQELLRELATTGEHKELRKQIVEIAAGAVAKARPASGAPPLRGQPLDQWREAWDWLGKWLVFADKFPYPVWVIYETYMRADSQRLDEFDEFLLPLLLETIGGDYSGRTYTHAPFNRSKLVILRESQELAASVYEYEGLVRIAAGFYPSLSLAVCASLCLMLVSLGVFAVCCFTYEILEIPCGVRIALLGWLAMFVFNCWLLEKVLRNLHFARSAEAYTVLESYLITCK